MAAEDEKDSATKVYARIRGIMPWEETFLGVNWTDSTISVKDKSYTFSSVLGPGSIFFFLQKVFGLWDTFVFCY